MKFLFLFMIVAFATTSFAQNKIMINGKDSLLMKDGRLWQVKVMTASITTKNGAIVMPDGSIKIKDGKTILLKNGDYINEDGNITSLDINPEPTSGVVMNDGKLLLIKASVKMSSDLDDCIRKDDGKFWVVKTMTVSITTKNGTIVLPDGTVKTKDGNTFVLKDKEGIDNKGNRIKMDMKAKAMNCMYMHDGKMMSMALMEKDMTLKSGLIVMINGTVKATNGKVTSIADGGMVPVDDSYVVTKTADK